jgi:hypothetical protein
LQKPTSNDINARLAKTRLLPSVYAGRQDGREWTLEAEQELSNLMLEE